MKTTYLLLILCLGFFDMGYTQESEVQVSVDTSYADDVMAMWNERP